MQPQNTFAVICFSALILNSILNYITLNYIILNYIILNYIMNDTGSGISVKNRRRIKCVRVKDRSFDPSMNHMNRAL